MKSQRGPFEEHLHGFPDRRRCEGCRAVLLDGVLFFPVTPFAADGTIDTGVLAEHLRRGLAAGPGGVFAACRTANSMPSHRRSTRRWSRPRSRRRTTGCRSSPGAGGPLPTAIPSPGWLGKAGHRPAPAAALRRPWSPASPVWRWFDAARDPACHKKRGPRKTPDRAARRAP